MYINIYSISYARLRRCSRVRTIAALSIEIYFARMSCTAMYIVYIAPRLVALPSCVAQIKYLPQPYVNCISEICRSDFGFQISNDFLLNCTQFSRLIAYHLSIWIACTNQIQPGDIPNAYIWLLYTPYCRCAQHPTKIQFDLLFIMCLCRLRKISFSTAHCLWEGFFNQIIMTQIQATRPQWASISRGCLLLVRQ